MFPVGPDPAPGWSHFAQSIFFSVVLIWLLLTVKNLTGAGGGGGNEQGAVWCLVACQVKP